MRTDHPHIGNGEIQRSCACLTYSPRTTEPHPTGKHEQLFKNDAIRLARLFAAGVPVIAVGLHHYRFAGPLPRGFVWGEDE